MLDSYKIEDYYTMAEVAKMLGLEKQTIYLRCKGGFYTGAFKTEPTGTDKKGLWLIPKSCIDTPHLIQDVATLTRQINPLELERAMTNAIMTAVTRATEPLTEKLNEQSLLIRQLQENAESSTHKIDEISQNVGELSRSARKQSDQDPDWSLWRVVLTLVFVVGIVFALSVIFVKYLQ